LGIVPTPTGLGDWLSDPFGDAYAGGDAKNHPFTG